MSDVVNELQHELKCRAQIIEDLQRDLDRAKQMTNSANLSALRMRDELIMVIAQTHGIMKATMMEGGFLDLTILRASLKKVQTWVLEKGDRKDLEPGDISFTMREMTDEEKEKEETLRRQANLAIKRVEENVSTKEKTDENA